MCLDCNDGLMCVDVDMDVDHCNLFGQFYVIVKKTEHGSIQMFFFFIHFILKQVSIFIGKFDYQLTLDRSIWLDSRKIDQLND